MDVLQKAISCGALGYLLSDNLDPDISSWVVHNILPTPETYSSNVTKHYFDIPALDHLLGGIHGLWEIHGKKSSGKTSLCLKLAKNSPGTVLYTNISGMLCQEFKDTAVNPT